MQDSNVVECPLAVAWCEPPSGYAQKASEGGRCPSLAKLPLQLT